ncbi:MAG: hypothetical protein JJW00_00985, partial [Sulfurimonas sp.]|nr:hypothetical protein [Sulfurimonas sp.]
GTLFKLLFRVSLHKNNQITSFLFIFLLNLSMPIVGYIATVWLVWYLVNVKYSKKVIQANVLNLEEFQTSFLKIQRIFGEGSLSELMENPFASKEKKLKALSSLATDISPVNLKIVKQTLTSTDDEIRMFGYAIINKAEKNLNDKINRNIEILNTQNRSSKNKDKELIAQTSKGLAYLYWELIYTELAHESLKNNFLERSLYYINSAKEYYLDRVVFFNSNLGKLSHKENKKKLNELNKICADLYLLLGRISMYKEDYVKAKTEFTVAQELNPYSDNFVLPYLAEVYFLTGNYAITKTLLSRTKDLEMNSTLYPIIQQWKAS